MSETTSCPNGHEMTPENSKPRSDQPGKFRCRECQKAHHRAWVAANPEGAVPSPEKAREYRKNGRERKSERQRERRAGLRAEREAELARWSEGRGA